MFPIFKNIRLLDVKKYKKMIHFSVSSKLNTIDKNTKGFHLDLSFEENAFRSIFPLVHNEVIQEQLNLSNTFLPLKDRYSKLLNHTLNLDTKYLAKGILLVYIYRNVEKPSLISPELIKRASILGWAHKLMEASIILNDDIVDESEIRYNKPTWFKLKDVGKNEAIFDAAFLATGAHLLLVNHFSSHPQYVNIQRDLIKCFSINNVAQIMETRKHSLVDFERCQNFAKLYPFTLPLVSSALYLANLDDRDIHKASKEFCIDISHYIKIEDDVNCVFNSKHEKVCTDVSLGRASWLAIEAYKKSTPFQKKILNDHYGKQNVDSVLTIYNIFKELKLDEHFYKFKEEFYEQQVQKINKMPKTVPNHLFLNLLCYITSGNCQA